MNPALRYSIMLFLILIGGATAMAQESVRTTQTVNFAIYRTAGLSLQEKFALKETKTNLSVTKVTVFRDHPSNNPLKESSLLRTRKPHLDMAAIHSTDLQITFRDQSLLLTITD